MQTKPPIKIGMYVLVVGLCCLLSACSNVLRLSTTHTTTPVPTRPTEQPIYALHHAQRTVTFCGDITSSYPYADFMAAKAKISDGIDSATQVNQDGLTAYYTLINSDSWDPASTIATIQVPALSADPPPPSLLPTPTPTTDPYASANAAKATKEANAKLLQGYNDTLSKNHAHLQQVVAQVHAQTRSVRELRPAIDTIQTDVFGCLERQADRLQSAHGEKYLFVASDGENNTLQQATGTLDLRGVHVRFIDFYCQNAPSCTNGYWHDLLMQAGASDVLIFDPSQTQTLPASSLFTS